MYLTYDEFLDMSWDIDGTALSENEFDELEFEAESLVNYWTFDRLKNDTEYSEAVKRVMFKLISLAYRKQNEFINSNNADNQTTGSISSQSNDGVSISYNVMSASEIYKTLEDESNSIIKLGLNGVRDSLGHRLLYRGIYPDE